MIKFFYYFFSEETVSFFLNKSIVSSVDLKIRLCMMDFTEYSTINCKETVASSFRGGCFLGSFRWRTCWEECPGLTVVLNGIV